MSPVVYTVDSQMEPSTSDTFADNITYFSHNSGSFVYDNFGINGGYEPYGTDSICNRHSKHDYEIPEQVCQACKSTQTNRERRTTVWWKDDIQEQHMIKKINSLCDYTIF